jgi:hypothetical protein
VPEERVDPPPPPGGSAVPGPSGTVHASEPTPVAASAGQPEIPTAAATPAARPRSAARPAAARTATVARPVGPPTPVAAAQPTAPAAAAPAAYTGPDPCTLATKGDSPVAKACAEGGIKAAKVKMKELLKAGRAAGAKYQCDDCHTNDADYAQLGKGADEKFAKLLAATKK